MLPQFTYLFLMDLTRIPMQTFDQYADNEPGFTEAMLQAYITAFQAPKSQKLSHDFLQTINRIAMSHRGSTGRYKTAANNYKVYFQYYKNAYAPKYSATHKGVVEFLNYWRKESPSMHGIQFKSVSDPSDYYLIDLIDGHIVCMNKGGQQVTDRSLETLMSNPEYECFIHSGLSQIHNVMALTIHAMQKVFNEYDDDIRVAVTEDDKIIAIARLIQHIAQAHPFDDGNIRTAYIAMNKLLRDHGLRLSILLDPNRLDCCDLASIVTMIKEGQRIFANLRNHSDLRDFPAITSDLYFQTISCPGCAIDSQLCNQFLQEVVLIDSLPFQESHPSPFFKPDPNSALMTALEHLTFKHEPCRPILTKHIAASNYEIALRNACFYGECAAIRCLIDNLPTLNLNGQSKDGSTALDYLDQLAPEDPNICAIKSRLRGLGALTKAELPQKTFK